MIVDKIKKATYEAKDEPIRPLVALGSATMDAHYDNYSKLFKLAEDRMYMNKMNDSERTYDLIIASIKKDGLRFFV